MCVASQAISPSTDWRCNSSNQTQQQQQQKAYIRVKKKKYWSRHLPYFVVANGLGSPKEHTTHKSTNPVFLTMLPRFFVDFFCFQSVARFKPVSTDGVQLFIQIRYGTRSPKPNDSISFDQYFVVVAFRCCTSPRIGWNRFKRRFQEGTRKICTHCFNVALWLELFSTLNVSILENDRQPHRLWLYFSMFRRGSVEMHNRWETHREQFRAVCTLKQTWTVISWATITVYFR